MSKKLKQAIYILLYDSIDTHDLEPDSDDEDFIETILALLVENNKKTCPYKNYSCDKSHCENNQQCGGDRWDIDCGMTNKEVWREFIKAND